MSRKFKVAAIQMVSTHTVTENLATAAELIARAAGEGAELIALPEYFCILGQKDTDKVDARERFEDGGAGGPIQAWLAQTAQHHGVWLVGGTLPIDCGSSSLTKREPLSMAAIRRSPWIHRSAGLGYRSAMTCVFRSCTGPWVRPI